MDVEKGCDYLLICGDFVFSLDFWWTLCRVWYTHR